MNQACQGGAGFYLVGKQKRGENREQTGTQVEGGERSFLALFPLGSSSECLLY